ncbi:hypothetical protein DENIT_60084 [Pseudomonas veronii]|nr:hypothetical protein DENIT_60084 [Pseudomonas veronii]
MQHYVAASHGVDGSTVPKADEGFPSEEAALLNCFLVCLVAFVSKFPGGYGAGRSAATSRSSCPQPPAGWRCTAGST